MSPSSRSIRGLVRYRCSRFAAADADVSLPAWRALLSECARLAVLSGEPGDALAGDVWLVSACLVDRGGLAFRAGDSVTVKIDREPLLRDHPVLRGGAVHRGEHLDLALLELLANLDVAISGIADHRSGRISSGC
jgi:hypothetical protein